jgi:hypothetical protein
MHIVKMATNSESESSSSESGQSEISFATSNKGKPILIYENHIFKCNKIAKSKKYWLCDKRECAIYVHTSRTNEMICITGDHYHAANPDQIATKILRDKMKISRNNVHYKNI